MGYEGDTEQMNNTINTFATLLRSILNSSREDEISLQQEVNMLTNYLTLEQKMTSNPFEFEIHTETSDIDIEEIVLVDVIEVEEFVDTVPAALVSIVLAIAVDTVLLLDDIVLLENVDGLDEVISFNT